MLHRFTLVLRNTFRRLEQVLSNSYHRSLVALPEADIRDLVFLVMASPPILSEEDMNSLARMMKIAFDLPIKPQEN